MLMCELRNQATAPLVCWPPGTSDQQCWPERIADVLDGIPGAILPVDLTTSMTWTTVSPTPNIVTAITVASRKPSRRPMATMPRIPIAEVGKASLEVPEGIYLLANPMDSVMKSKMMNVTDELPPHQPQTDTAERFPHSRRRGRLVLSRPRLPAAMITGKVLGRS